MKEIRWAVVGTGEVSATITPDFALAGNARIVAISSRSPEAGRAFSRRFDIPQVFDSYESLLASDSVDAVYLGTPHAVHHSMALLAVNAGKHVLVEKPLALNGTQAREILDLARQKGLFAMEAMWSAFSPNMHQILHAVKSGDIGEPRSVRATFGAPFPAGAGSRWQSSMGGSTLLDQGIYPVSLAHAIFGMPTSMTVHGVVRSDGVDLAEHVTMEFSGGRYAQIAASMVEFVEPSASINGTRGWITIPAPFWANSRFTLHGGGFPQAIHTSEEREVSLEGHGFTPMIRAASKSIQTGQLEHPLHTRKQTLEVFEILDQIRSSLVGNAVL